jgi:hypothetical protein
MTTRTGYRLVNSTGWCWKHGEWEQVVMCDTCGAMDTKCCVRRMCRSFDCEEAT